MQTKQLKRLSRFLLGSLMFLTLAMPAGAQSGGSSGSSDSSSLESQRIIQSMTAKEAAALLKEAGFSELEIDKDDDIIVKMQGFKVLLMVGTNKNKWLLFKFAVSGTALDVKALNEWNKKVRYSRAYLDDDGDVILESDQDLNGGVTIQRVSEFAKSFDISLREFLKRLE
ncbi:MAG: hypothetical protein CVV27_07740 [Candidatus Melainabacteria bacterium HGW-Melainabacteria-1]|nr:MAG: hypothetical protein CVV27_07740 [Candidatus Melainabacteria bacterium HGW-Melainabacteria-1]